jgi:hypothetical protein
MTDDVVREPIDLTRLVPTAQEFWRTQLPNPGERIILVEAMSQDLRVTLRNLSVANALRRIEPARLVVYSGADEDWNQVVWSYFDLDTITRLCEAYGAEQVFDIHRLVDDRVAGRPVDLNVAGVDLGGPLPEPELEKPRFDGIVEATACRMAMIARLDGSADHAARRDLIARRTAEFARIYDALIGNNEVVAVVTSHVDYNNFAPAAESALRHGIPVLFPQSTGDLKAYALFPEHVVPGEPVRASLTCLIAEWFEDNVWRHRDLLASGAELAVHRSKQVQGRPSWWRGGASYSSVDLRSTGDRAVMRRVAARRVGLDPEKPVVCVFNHAVSDALWTNVEAYPDLGAWFEATAAYAAEHDEVSWLFLDHPSQHLYDSHDFFGAVAARYADHDHMAFRPSMELSKNVLVSLTDLVLTVRGSVSNEYPALGIPALQSGWSEWSACGFTTVATTVADYVARLDEHCSGLVEGRALIEPEQVERARLWAWFYQAGSDVPSALVPPWRLGDHQELFDTLTLNLAEVPPDGDPVLAAVRRMWTRREPFLTRFDLAGDHSALADVLAPAAVVR